MSNNPTPPRIEREAYKYVKKLARVHTTDTDGARSCWMTDFKAGYAVAENRAAPVVKALEDALEQHEADKKKLIESYPQLAEKFEAAVLPWVTNAKQILQTYKADQ